MNETTTTGLTGEMRYLPQVTFEMKGVGPVTIRAMSQYEAGKAKGDALFMYMQKCIIKWPDGKVPSVENLPPWMFGDLIDQINAASRQMSVQEYLAYVEKLKEGEQKAEGQAKDF